MIRRRGKFYVQKDAFGKAEYASKVLELFLDRVTVIKITDPGGRQPFWYEVVCDLFDPISDFDICPEYIVSPELNTEGFHAPAHPIEYTDPDVIKELLRRTTFIARRKLDIGLQ